MKGLKSMNVKVEKTEKNNEVKLSFQIEAEKFEEAIKKVFVKNAKYFSIPGFRKGKAPLNIVEKHYGSAIFYEDAFNELVPEIYENAVKENNLEVVSRPDIDITQMEKGKDLIFTAIVQTKPDVKLGKYKGIEIKKIEYNVSNEDIEHELEHMAERNSRLINVTDRPVEDGDTVIIDFDGSVDGVHFEGGKAENYELKIGSNTFIPGFEEQLKGMKIDEEKDIKVQFHNHDCQNNNDKQNRQRPKQDRLGTISTRQSTADTIVNVLRYIIHRYLSLQKIYRRHCFLHQIKTMRHAVPRYGSDYLL